MRSADTLRTPQLHTRLLLPQIVTVEAADLVPGDVILVRLGDIVPADIKLLGEEDEQPMQVRAGAREMFLFETCFNSLLCFGEMLKADK